MNEDADYIFSSLKQLHLGHYLACLYLPEKIRQEVAVLWAFNATIDQIADLVSEPMPGEIRLQWWRDLIRARKSSDGGPLARCLLRVIETHDLPIAPLDQLLEARIFDLYNDPMPDFGTLEGYWGETRSVLYHYAAFVAGGERSSELAQASGHAGIVHGCIELLYNVTKHRSRRQVLIPQSMLAENALSVDTWLSGKIVENHIRISEKMVAYTESHMEKARMAVHDLPRKTRQTFLPLCLAKSLLNRLKKHPACIFEHPASLSEPMQHWTMFKAAITGKY